METIIIFAGKKAKVNCDEKCEKAFGINSRPRVQLSENLDDYAFLADDELARAPADSGFSIGGIRKPINKKDIPNKWCINECERCNMSAMGKSDEPLEVRDFSIRRHNIPKNDWGDKPDYKVNQNVRLGVYEILVNAYVKFAKMNQELPVTEKYLKNNGYNIMTVCPECHVDDFTHVEDCGLAKEHEL